MNRRPHFVSDYSHVSRQQPVQQIPVSFTHPTKEKKQNKTNSAAALYQVGNPSNRKTSHSHLPVNGMLSSFPIPKTHIHIPYQTPLSPDNTVIVLSSFSPLRVYLIYPLQILPSPGNTLLDSAVCGSSNLLHGHTFVDLLDGALDGRRDALHAALDRVLEEGDVAFPSRGPGGRLRGQTLIGAGHHHVEGGERGYACCAE